MLVVRTQIALSHCPMLAPEKTITVSSKWLICTSMGVVPSKAISIVGGGVGGGLGGGGEGGGGDGGGEGGGGDGGGAGGGGEGGGGLGGECTI